MDKSKSFLKFALNQLQMKKNSFYTNYCTYKNEVDLVNKLLTVYSVVKKNNNLRNFELNVLNYYVRKGYSSDTKKQIMKELDMNPRNLNQTNYHLKNKGYLIQSSRNQKDKKLNKDLQEIRELFIENKSTRIYAIGFKQK